VGVGSALGELEGEVEELGDEHGRVAEVDADVGDLHLAGEAGAGLEHQPGLERRERHRLRRVHGFTVDGAGLAVHAGWDVDGDARAEHGVDGAGHPRRVAVERAAEAGAEHGVDERVRPQEGPLAELAIDAAVEREHVDPDAPLAQGAGRDVPVAAVVALAAHDDRAPPVRAAHLPTHGPRDGAPGAFHEHVDRRAGRDRAPVGLAHLGRREHGTHDSPCLALAHGDGHRHRHRVAVREREVPGGDPALVGEDRRLSVQGDDGRAAALSHHLDVTQLERAQAHAERLHHRLLGAEPGREPGRRVVMTKGVRALVVAEQPLGETLPPLHREAEPVDLHQVGADPDDVHGPLASPRPLMGLEVTPIHRIIACATARRAR
jgi:hypothetical protein